MHASCRRASAISVVSDRMGRRSDARARLVTRAGDLFRERGYSSVGVAQLCETAGVNKGSFYHFFPAKRDLLLEVIDGEWDETGMLHSWGEARFDRPLDQLRLYLEELFARHYADRELHGRVRGSLVANIAHELGSLDPLVARKIDELLEREIAAFGSLLSHARRRGDVRLHEPRETAEALVACLHGLVMLAKVRDDLRILPRSERDLLRLAGAETG